MKRILGGLMILMGLILGGWIVYNLLVQRQPEGTGNPLGPLVFTAGLLFVGTMWARGKAIEPYDESL